MKTLGYLAMALLIGCEAPKQVDAACKPYVAIPGEPCRDGHWLFVSNCESKIPVCRCDESVSP